jgi:hypothetical protein
MDHLCSCGFTSENGEMLTDSSTNRLTAAPAKSTRACNSGMCMIPSQREGGRSRTPRAVRTTAQQGGMIWQSGGTT